MLLLIYLFVVFSMTSRYMVDTDREGRNLHRTIAEVSGALSECLGERGYAENSSKQEVWGNIPCRSASRRFFMFDDPCGRVLLSAKHLGGLFSPKCSNSPEVIARIAAADRGWNQCHGFWFSRVPWKLKILLFMIRVLSLLHSGLT